jgi:ABC-type transport system involved in multi-copper enzyme maturation permease subunit
MNPVARRELQERFRTLRSPLLLSAWVLATGAITFLAYLFAKTRADERIESFASAGVAGFGSVVASSSMGRFILHALLLGLLTAVVFVVPGQAAVTIVGERERQTLPLLQASQLSAFSIVIGKLMSAIAYILLLLVASTPLLVIPVLLGGVSIWEVLAGVGMVMAAALMIGAISMWISARAKSVQGAVLGSYVWTVALVLGTLALVLAELLLLAPSQLDGRRIESGISRTDGHEVYAAWLNPYLGLVDASTDVLEFRPEIVQSPYGPLRDVLVERQGVDPSMAADQYDPFAAGLAVRSDTAVAERVFVGQQGIVTTPPRPTRILEPARGRLWWKTLIFEMGLTVVALGAAARLVKVPRQRIRVFPRRPADVA